jgi:AAA domain
MIDAVIDRFGLTRMPFGRDLPPGRLHRHANCAEAAARITWAVAGKTIGVVTGEVGTGKTVAVRAAVAGLDPAAHTVVYIGNPAAGTRGILTRVVTALGGRPAHGTAALAVQAWNVLAGEAAERGRTPVLVLDEAYLLDHEQLESIRMLTLCRDRDYAGGHQDCPGGRVHACEASGIIPGSRGNARSLSGGRYLPVFVFGDEVRARAFSLSLRSAWIYGCVDRGLSCPIQRAMVTGSTPACSKAMAAV